MKQEKSQNFIKRIISIICMLVLGVSLMFFGFPIDSFATGESIEPEEAVSEDQAQQEQSDEITDEVDVVITDDPSELALPPEAIDSFDDPIETGNEVEAESEVLDAFRFKRLMLFADYGSLTDSRGAASLAFYDFADEYILDFDSVEDAYLAYLSLTEEFGEENVIPDIPIYAESEKFTETDSLSESWGSDAMHLDRLRDAANADSKLVNNVTVAVLDSGINESHELFTDRIDAKAASFVGDSKYSSDEMGHGTHVSGIIADGTSDHVKILPIKILDDEGKGGICRAV